LEATVASATSLELQVGVTVCDVPLDDVLCAVSVVKNPVRIASVVEDTVRPVTVGCGGVTTVGDVGVVDDDFPPPHAVDSITASSRVEVRFIMVWGLLRKTSLSAGTSLSVQ
jgi:hypothetical protein